MKILLMVITLVLFATSAFANILTFDDITDQIVGGDSLPAGYGGFTWSYVGYFHEQYIPINYPTSNYANGVYSGNYSAFNEYGYLATVSGSTFDFNGAYLTSAWNDENWLTVTGYLNNVQKYQVAVQLDLVPTQYFAFNFLGIDELTFSSSNLQFVMDDFTYNASVPETSTMLILGSGLIGLLGFRRKFKK